MEKLTILDRAQVTKRTSLKRDSIDNLARAGKFPTPIRLASRRIGWVESEVEQWIADKIKASRETLDEQEVSACPAN